MTDDNEYQPELIHDTPFMGPVWPGIVSLWSPDMDQMWTVLS